MVALRVWWQNMSEVDKAVRTIGGVLILLYGGVLGFDRIYQQPKRVDQVVATNERQDLLLAEHTVALERVQAQRVADQPMFDLLTCGEIARQQNREDPDCLRNYFRAIGVR